MISSPRIGAATFAVLAILATWFSLAPQTGPATAAEYKKGDVDCSGGNPNPLDGLGVLRGAANLAINRPGDCTASTDMDCGNGTTGADTVPLLRYTAGLPSGLPGGCPDIGTTPAPTPTPGPYTFTFPPFYTDPDQFEGTVASLQRTNSVPGTGFYDTVNAPAGADFAVLLMNVRNYGSSADSVGSYSIRLADNVGRIYTIDFTDDLTVNSTAQAYHSRQGLYDTIQPGLTLSSVFVFLVPDGTAPLTAQACPEAGCDDTPLVGTPPGGCSFTLPPFYTDPHLFCATDVTTQLVNSIPGSGFYDPVNAPPGSDFAVTMFNASNYGFYPESIGSFSLRLRDNLNRVYTIDFQDDITVSSTAQAYYQRRGLYDTIQPGLVDQMVFVFLVPDGAPSLVAEACPEAGCDDTTLVGTPPGGCSFTLPPFYTDPHLFCATGVTTQLVNSIPGSGFYDPVNAPPGSDFAVTMFNASNYGYYPDSIGSFSFRLRDSLNRMFTIDFQDDINVNSTAQAFHNRRGLYDTIQPGLVDQMVFVFLVPDGAPGLLAEACPDNGCD